MRPCLVLIVALAGCAKDPPTELITLPSGSEYRVQTHERVSQTTGDMFSVVYVSDVHEPDLILANAQELFQWAQPDAESAELDRVSIEAHHITDALYGMAKHVNAIEVVYQKGPNGEWGHSRPRTPGQK